VEFGGEATADTVRATHQFNSPGLYTVTLRVTDELGETDTSTVDIRVRGAAPTRALSPDVTTGTATLVVQFDGTTSTAPDDTIRDYVWDLMTVARPPAPDPSMDRNRRHYNVKLTVRTYGGVEGVAFITIQVEESSTHSLQFDGSQVALLALGSSQTLTDWTFEAWVKPTSTGGTVVSTLDGRLVLEVLPSTNKLRYQAGEPRMTSALPA